MGKHKLSTISANGGLVAECETCGMSLYNPSHPQGLHSYRGSANWHFDLHKATANGTELPTKYDENGNVKKRYAR